MPSNRCQNSPQDRGLECELQIWHEERVVDRLIDQWWETDSTLACQVFGWLIESTIAITKSI